MNNPSHHTPPPIPPTPPTPPDPIRVLRAVMIGVAIGGLLSWTIAAVSRPLGSSVIDTFRKASDAATARAAIGAGSSSEGSFTNITIVGGSQTGLTNTDVTASRVVVSAADKTLTSLAAGTSTQVLHGNASGVPTWSALSLTADTTGTLPVESGGSEATTLTGMLKGNGTSAFTGLTGTQYGAGYWSDANTIGTTLAPATTNTFLRGNPAGAPTFAPVNLGNADVSGTLAATSLPASGVSANTYGGNAQTTWTAAVDTYGRITSASSSAIDGLDASVIDTGTLTVPRGGSGAATLTGYVIGNGTSAMTASATIPNTDITGLGTMSTQASDNVAITGGSIAGVQWTRTIVNVGAGTNTLTAAQSGALIVNDAAGGIAIINLPNATGGLEYSFRITDLDGMQLNAFTGETISIGDTTSAAAGLWWSTNHLGDRVKLVAKTNTTWVDESASGQWTVGP